ncbi:MAG: alpha/beta hydrolase [Calditrichaeota bacterium]|nr:alpha/beta hydrolase [Calditrichota bacterium]
MLFCLASPALIGQVGEITRDTSFTPRSAFQKERLRFPFIEMVRENPPPGVREHRGLVYRSIGFRELRLDLFQPADRAEKPFPAVLLVHGGGWRSGDKSHLVPMAQQLAQRGYVAASVAYRLSPEARYPAAVTDLKAALRWLRAHAEDFRIDTARIAILGCSSGAQLATLVGFTPGMAKFEEGENPDYPSTVQAVVNIDGVVDFTSDYVRGFEDDPRKNPSAAGAWFGGRFIEKEALWREASPLQYAGSGSPPILFVNSSNPRFHAGRDELLARLAAEGIYGEVYTFPDTPHPFWLFHPWFSETVDRVGRFLDKVLENK